MGMLHEDLRTFMTAELLLLLEMFSYKICIQIPFYFQYFIQ
jgi:hypothetical protein